MKAGRLYLVLAAVFLLSVIACAIIVSKPNARAAEIYVDGKLYRRIQLDVPQSFTVETEWGSNTVTVKDGAVSVSEASCPDHICMERGCCSSGLPIVCLPNRFSIHFVNDNGLDASAG